ncbi:MAG: hypothetical protein HY898_00435 [Deltaproteobacteria bacterium]|nr:hypothetical protein [Deltaproteobacteria bacterium]
MLNCETAIVMNCKKMFFCLMGDQCECTASGRTSDMRDTMFFDLQV